MMCSSASAFSRSKRERLRITSRRWSRYRPRRSFRVNSPGCLPPSSANRIAPKVLCSGVFLKSSAMVRLASAPRLSSTTRTDPLAVRFVTQVGHVRDQALAGEPGDPGDDPRLGHRVGKLGDHKLLLSAAQRFGNHAGAHHHPAPAGLVHAADALRADDEPAGGEVGPREHLHQIGGRAVGVCHQDAQRSGDLGEVVGRHVGAHPDRDTGAAVHEEVGEACRKDGRFLQPVVEVALPEDRVLVYLVQQLGCHRGEARLGVAVRGCRIAVDGAEVALAVNERIAQRKLLHHAYQGIVHGGIAVRVILAQNLAHDGRALLVVAVRLQSQTVHGEQDPPMNRLEAVPHIGKRPLNDHAHRVVEKRAAHLLLDEARQGHGYASGLPTFALPA